MPTMRNMGRTAARISLQATFVGALIAVTAAPAFAARTPGGSRNGGSSGSTPTGNDISYPQCGSSFPSSPAFGIAAVNGGLANDLNQCFGPSSSYPSYKESELYWAVAASTGSTRQPKAALYVNTGDPGNVYDNEAIADWPTSGTTPFGTCATTTLTTSGGSSIVGANSSACAWQYGYDKAEQDVSWLGSAASATDSQSPPVQVPSAAASYPWWLDVETGNTWQSGVNGQQMNVADLQGMAAALQDAGVSHIGAYSTSSQWHQITGGTTKTSGSLYGIPDWVPGATTLAGAESNCRLNSFTGGAITVTQWSERPDDGDYSC